MSTIHKKVKIDISTIIIDGEEKEHNAQQQSGELFLKDGKQVLTYEDKLEDGSLVKSLITIQKQKVTISRSGAIKMNQKFMAGQITENVYQHPHGKLHMETYTKTIGQTSSSDPIGGSVDIAYTVKLNGQDERNHTLRLAYNEEEHQ